MTQVTYTVYRALQLRRVIILSITVIFSNAHLALGQISGHESFKNLAAVAQPRLHRQRLGGCRGRDLAWRYLDGVYAEHDAALTQQLKPVVGRQRRWAVRPPCLPAD